MSTTEIVIYHRNLIYKLRRYNSAYCNRCLEFLTLIFSSFDEVPHPNWKIHHSFPVLVKRNISVTHGSCNANDIRQRHHGVTVYGVRKYSCYSFGEYNHLDKLVSRILFWLLCIPDTFAYHTVYQHHDVSILSSVNSTLPENWKLFTLLNI
jgi:hypothetical protein